MFNPYIYHHTISKINRSSKANSGINLPLWQSTIRHGFFIGPFRGVIRTVYEAFNRNSTLALASCASFWEENRSLRLSPSAGYSAMTFSPSILVSLQLYSKSTWKLDSLRLNKLCFPTANPTKVDVYFSPLDFIYLSSNTSRFDDWSHVCRRACPQPGVDNVTFALSKLIASLPREQSDSIRDLAIDLPYGSSFTILHRFMRRSRNSKDWSASSLFSL